MAGNMESLLMGSDDSSSDDSDNETPQIIPPGNSAVPAAAAIAATVQAAQPPPAQPAPSPAPASAPATATANPTLMQQHTKPPGNTTTATQSDLSSRLKGLYSPANKAPQQQKTSATLKVQAAPPPATRPVPQQRQAMSTQQLHMQTQKQQQQQTLQARANMPPTAPAATSRITMPQSVPMQQTTQQGTPTADFRPLMPNRGVATPSQQTQPQQTQKRTSASADPFEPTPLKTMIQRQQQKAAQAAAAGKQQQQHTPMRTTAPSQSATANVMPPKASMRSTNSNASSGSNTSTSTIMASNVTTVQAKADRTAQLEREAKGRKERFLMFTRVLMKYLEQKDPAMHLRAKAVIRECAEKNKKKEAGYESVTASMQKRLKEIVGDQYWTRAEAYLNHFLKQKEKVDGQKRGGHGLASSSSSQPQSSVQAKSQRPSQPQQQHQQQKQLPSSSSQSHPTSSFSKPTKTPQQIAKERQVAEATQKKLEDIKREKEKIKQAELKRRKQEEEKRKLDLKKAQQQKDMVARMAAMEAAKQQQTKKKKDQKRKNTSGPSPSTVTAAAAAAASTARMSPMATRADKVEKPPPREYSELMQTVDHAVDYDWTSAGVLMGGDRKAETTLNAEQKRLLYANNLAPPRPPQPASDLPASMRGWGKRNVLSSRGAWARVRLREQKEQIEAAKQKVPVVAGLKLPTDPKQGDVPETPVLTPEATWFNEDQAEQDKTLALLSEATEMYLKSMLQKAIAAARQRENLDGIRLWHLQHGPTKPPMALRLGCDVTRQVAQAEGNAAKTVQRMEEALERQRHVPAKARDLNNAETVYNASSMSDLALRPLLASAGEEADANAKRCFGVYGGMYTTAPPLGRVPKRPKVTKRDFVAAQEWSDYGHQRRGIASPHIM